MAIGALLYRGVRIAVDVFSNARGSLRPGEVRVLDDDKPLKEQVFEALSGHVWDETMERLDRKWTVLALDKQSTQLLKEDDHVSES